MVFLQELELHQEREEDQDGCTLLTPGLDNTRLFMSLTAGAGTKIRESVFISKPSLSDLWMQQDEVPSRSFGLPANNAASLRTARSLARSSVPGQC